MKKQKVLIVSTGGTIEKTYSETEGSLLNRRTQIKERFLKKLRLPYLDIEIHEIMAKDSLYITGEDRQFIHDKILIFSEMGHPIVLLHGTDTLEVTARFLFEKILNPKVAVVFTGAMKPAGFEDSDALQNFTEALCLAQVMEPGFYVAFHGHLFKVPNVRKNPAKGTFEEYQI